MWLEMILPVAVGLWIVLTLVVISMCRASARGDDVMDAELEPVLATERSLRTLSPEHAAALLGVSSHTLIQWGERYGFPTASPSQPRYSQADVLALRDSLKDGLSIASAVSRARERSKGRRAAPARVLDRRDGGLAS